MAARLSRAVKPDGPVVRTADNSAKGKQLLLMAGNKSSANASDYAADMRRQAVCCLLENRFWYRVPLPRLTCDNFS